jgi:hypothetical protein
MINSPLISLASLYYFMSKIYFGNDAMQIFYNGPNVLSAESKCYVFGFGFG